MSSNWQHVDVPILGLNTQRDPKLGPAGRLLKCDNGVMDRNGEVRQRNGFKLLSTQLQESTGSSGAGANQAAPYDCTGVASSGDRLMAAFLASQFSSGSRSLYEWSPSANLWSTKQIFAYGCTPPVSRCEAKRVMELANSDLNIMASGVVEECDTAVNGNFLCCAYREVLAGVNYISVKIVDLSTGTVLASDITIATGARPRVVALNTNPWNFAVFYNTGANLDQVAMTTYVVTSANEADRVATFANLINGTGTNGRSNYDVIARPSGTDIILTWANWDGAAASYFPQWRSVNFATGAVGAIVTGTASAGTTAVDNDSRVSFAASDSTTGIYVYMRGMTSGVKRTNITASTLAEASITTIDAAATAASRNNAQVEGFFESGGRSFVAARGATGAISLYDATTNNTGAAVGSIMSSLYGERGATSGQMVPYFLVSSGGDSPTVYLCRYNPNSNDMTPISRLNIGSSGFAFTAGFEWPSSLASHSTGLYAVVPVVTEKAATGSAYNSRVSLFLVKLTMRTDYLSNAVPLADAVLFPGGVPYGYDAIDTRPLGSQPAEKFTVIGSATAGGLVSGGTYKYRFVVTSMLSGRLYRSPPSLPVTIVTTAVTSTLISQVAQMSGLNAEAERVEIYRTVNAGDTYYRVANLAVLPWGASQTYTDSATTDAQLVSNELLYTTGNVLDSYPAPASKHIAAWGNRLFAVSSEFPNRIYFSKTIVEGLGVGFNPALYVEVADAFGDFVAVAATDRALIAFKANAIYAITGDGPDNTGQNTFSVQQISIGMGCTSDRSIVATPAGLMFKGANGINLLDRGFAASFVGGPVTEYVDATTIVGSCVIPGRELACWVASNGHAYVWDWEQSQWFRWVTPATSCVGCCEYQGTLVVADASGRVYQETIGQTYDHGTTTATLNQINMSVTFAPLAFGAIAGFERCQEIVALGQVDADCRVTATVNYDYSDTEPQATIANVIQAANVGQLVRMKINRQKASAYEINIRVTHPIAPFYSAGFRLSALTARIAAKRSLNKRAAPV